MPRFRNLTFVVVAVLITALTPSAAGAAGVDGRMPSSITVTRNGRTRTQNDRHVAHIGAAVDTSVFPASPCGPTPDRTATTGSPPTASFLSPSALFLSPAEATITLVPSRNSQLAEVFGADSATADAFGFSGFIPENPASVEIITMAGTVGPLAEIAAQNRGD